MIMITFSQYQQTHPNKKISRAKYERIAAIWKNAPAELRRYLVCFA